VKKISVRITEIYNPGLPKYGAVLNTKPQHFVAHAYVKVEEVTLYTIKVWVSCPDSYVCATREAETTLKPSTDMEITSRGTREIS
jgi:hypothetical protein